MKNKDKSITIVVFLFLVAVLIIMVFVFPHSKWEGGLVSPLSSLMPKAPEPTSTSAPSPTPKTFKFDSSTDLKKELEGINPKVEESDFADLNK